MARWFQSDLSIGDRCEILEGDAFTNKVVARAETPEIAAAIVAKHNALEDFVIWVDCWVGNPVGAYSVDALDGLFEMTRDRIAALASVKETSK